MVNSSKYIDNHLHTINIKKYCKNLRLLKLSQKSFKIKKNFGMFEVNRILSDLRCFLWSLLNITDPVFNAFILVNTWQSVKII